MGFASRGRDGLRIRLAFLFLQLCQLLDKLFIGLHSRVKQFLVDFL